MVGMVYLKPRADPHDKQCVGSSGAGLFVRLVEGVLVGGGGVRRTARRMLSLFHVGMRMTMQPDSGRGTVEAPRVVSRKHDQRLDCRDQAMFFWL